MRGIIELINSAFDRMSEQPKPDVIHRLNIRQKHLSFVILQCQGLVYHYNIYRVEYDDGSQGLLDITTSVPLIVKLGKFCRSIGATDESLCAGKHRIHCEGTRDENTLHLRHEWKFTQL